MKLAKAAFDAITAHAVAEYPFEACGLLVGVGDAIAEAVPCINHQNRYHAKLPDEFPRDAATAYFLDYRDIERVAEEARARGQALRGIFHSHVDCGAYFSAEDRVVALSGGDAPTFPDFVQIVVSVESRVVKAARAFCWDAAVRDFVEVEIKEG
ncbi:MAG: M67 family metallopeptidase [Deltaproteobacteria bacterium]|nr:M67 family metallopeptidase [Deltaproteobacteria bacterium]